MEKFHFSISFNIQSFKKEVESDTFRQGHSGGQTLWKRRFKDGAVWVEICKKKKEDLKMEQFVWKS